jgi:hypothetical protein
MKHLPLPSLDWLKQHLAVDPNQPSGLVWIKSYACIKANDMAGSINTNGYYQVRIKGRLYLTHRIIYYLLNDQDPGDKVIDHINGKDNNIEIRCATYSQNNLYAKPQSRQTTSKYKGVNWDRNKWVARITYKGIVYNLGRFNNELEAAEAYDRKARELDPEFTFLNFG